MNPNPPTPDPSHSGDDAQINEAVLRKLKSYRWKGRALTTIALGVGLLAILAGIILAWANTRFVMPMEQLLIQDYPRAVRPADTNSVAASPMQMQPPPLPQAELDIRHAQVTFAHGKELFLLAASIVLLGVGTFLTLLLVIFNRHVTLRQINASLAQISSQISEMQRSKGSGAA
jgi:hypothetical protein